MGGGTGAAAGECGGDVPRRPFQRRTAKRLGVETPRPGAVAFLQNFTSALLLLPHAHVLVAEGVFHGEDNAFAPLPPPEDEDVEWLLRRVARRVWKLDRARHPDGLPWAEDAKAALTFECPCGGRRRVLALVTHPHLARKILGLSSAGGRPLPTGPLQRIEPIRTDSDRAHGRGHVGAMG